MTRFATWIDEGHNGLHGKVSWQVSLSNTRNKCVVYSDILNYKIYDMPSDILKKIYNIFQQKEAEISFITKMTINGTQEIFKTNYYPIVFFSHRIGDSIYIFPGINVRRGNGPILLYFQEIELPYEKLSKIESIECSYELQEK